ncbi:histidinol dehydrogenase [Entomobacter blattae]|uniref:Histidinol dehydrogenase n=1 Tax=Entomobacter blattae TaxID=2762277 RepID=A0A7H1NS95_9PROT|nr:histidinol dehydrogenase [Entomobacter blattae]QNT78655.1 Histidinol dehydrogenase [Entomobacter blattae]
MKQLSTNDTNFTQAFAAILSQRENNTSSVSEQVREILTEIRHKGDTALFAYTQQFDKVAISETTLRVKDTEILDAWNSLSSSLREALILAAQRIESFHKTQIPENIKYTDQAGVLLGMKWLPLDAVGLYVPGGKAAYPSSVLMNAIPAKVAGVKRMAMCVPTPAGQLNPLVLAAAKQAGVTEIYRVGGAQAIGAMAYGTKSIAPVDRIVGPGNAYVAEAKRQVFGYVGIDSIAGPSEVVIIADAQNSPQHIAMDLLAQAEHDEMAQSILMTDDESFAKQVIEEVYKTLIDLPRAAIAKTSWENHGAVIIVKNWQEALELVNQIAPEHLELMVEHPKTLFEGVRHAGSVFMGHLCPEAIGDYVAGPNHVLPTNRTARFASGLSVFDFLKRTTFMETSANSLRRIGPAGVTLAEAEGLHAHAASIALRLKDLDPLP